jgi:hypothetical protein
MRGLRKAGRQHEHPDFLDRIQGALQPSAASVLQPHWGINASWRIPHCALACTFGNSPEFWMNLQSHYDLKMARRNLKPEDAKRIKASRAA